MWYGVTSHRKLRFASSQQIINCSAFEKITILMLKSSNHVPLTPTSASAWIRRTLAESIRSRSPYAVNLLLAGLDTSPASVAERGVTSHLYWIDYLGTKAVVPYAAHGLGQYVCLSTMDKWWRPEMDAKGGVDVLKMCVDEVEKRESFIAF